MMTRKLGGQALGAGGVLLLALTGCVETGRDSSPTGAADSECPWDADDSIDTAVTIAWQANPTGTWW